MPERAPRRRILRQGALAGLGLRGALIASSQLALDLNFAQAATVLAMRAWPAPDYTRVTFELDVPLKATQRLLANPPRLIIDMEGIDATPERLASMMPRPRPDDPHIAGARFSSPKPRSVRLEIDLKTGVTPDVFSLPPVASYRHRLVIDLHSSARHDPLRGLLEDRNRAPGDPIGDLLGDRGKPGDAQRQGAPARAHQGDARRGIFTIAIDAGHGGEDPGAIGPGGTREKDVVLDRKSTRLTPVTPISRMPSSA